MTVAQINIPGQAGEVGREAHKLITELYPICRSISGNGVRETLGRVGQHIPLAIREVASGTQVFANSSKKADPSPR
jgi:aminopeptidase-like protein